MSNKNSFITQAFKQFGEILDEELDTEEGAREVPIYEVNDNTHEFLDTAGEDESVDIMDLEAETIEDLKQSYVGKVVLDCNVCHSNIFIDKEDIIVDEEGVANLDMECPYCMSNEGYTIIGKITPYENEEEEVPEEVEDTEIEIEEVPEEEPVDEGLISKEEHARGYSNVYADVEKGITTDSEAGVVTDELDKQLKEGVVSEDDINECGDTETVQEELELDGEPELRGVGKLRHRDDKEGVEEIRGKNNTDLSGTDDLHESITEETDITTVKVDALSNGPEDEEEFKSWLANHYPNLSCEFTDDIYDNLILTGPKQDIKKYLLKDYSYEVEGEDWVVTQYPQLKESITESTEKFEIAPAGQGKWKVLKNSVDGGRVSEDSRIVIDADTKEEAKEILLANGFKAEELLESIENVSIDTDDETITMTSKEDGGVAVETTPSDDTEETFDDEVEIDDEPELEEGDEVITPIDDEEEGEIELNSEVDALDADEIEAIETPDEVEIDEFDEDSFDELGESYLTKHYNNVEGFKTVNVKTLNDSLIVEGVIRFNSGNSKCTSFVFEASQFDSKNNSALFEGYNNQISRGRKTFKMNCSIVEGKVIPTKLSYNYRTKNELNESVRVSGTCNIGK